MQLEKKTAGVAERLSIGIAAPQRRGLGVAVGTGHRIAIGAKIFFPTGAGGCRGARPRCRGRGFGGALVASRRTDICTRICGEPSAVFAFGRDGHF